MSNLKRLSPKEVQRIVSLKDVFTRAQFLTGVAWQAVAAVWYRESFSISPPKTPGGPFQFDPEPTDSLKRELLIAFCPSLTEVEREALVKKGVNDFAAGAIFAACWLRRKSGPNLSKDHSDAAIADAFYGYNGRAWGRNPLNSPYVANELDEAHKGMIIRGTIPDGKGGRIHIENVDARPGALTVYKQLVELNV